MVGEIPCFCPLQFQQKCSCHSWQSMSTCWLTSGEPDFAPALSSANIFKPHKRLTGPRRAAQKLINSWAIPINSTHHWKLRGSFLQGFLATLFPRVKDPPLKNVQKRRSSASFLARPLRPLNILDFA